MKNNRRIKFEQVFDIENIKLAEQEARKGKNKHYGVRKFHKDYDKNIQLISEFIKNKSYKTPQPVFESRQCDHGKIRVLAKVKYFYHVIHHAVMRVILPELEKSYHPGSAAGIRGRGIHYAAKLVKKFINKHKNHQLWWAQIDFVKCYHNIDRNLLYQKLCKRFKDPGIRFMLHDVIWALGNHTGLAPGNNDLGVGIGLYPTQPLINFYFNDLDRAASSVKNVRIFRYCDNLLIIGFSPKAVGECINVVKNFIKTELNNQPIHNNIEIQKLDNAHPINFIGYKFYLNKTLVRSATKIRIYKIGKMKLSRLKLQKLASYKGWLMHCNGLTLWKNATKMNSFKELNEKFKLINDSNITVTKTGERFFNVPTTKLSYLVNKQIVVKDFEDNCTTINGGGRMWVLIEVSVDQPFGNPSTQQLKFCTNNIVMKDILKKLKEQNEIPFTTTISVKLVDGNKTSYYFS